MSFAPLTLAGLTGSGAWFGVFLVANGSATVTTSTLSGNSVGLTFDFGGTAALTNTLLAQGNSANCAFAGVTSSALTNSGHNLADDTTCFADASGTNGTSHTVSTGFTGLDPAGLQANGGPTTTIALTPTSSALGGGATCPMTDQRGVARARAPATCDIGAYEAPRVTLTTGTTGSGSGTVSPPSGPQVQGAVVSVAATASGGSAFAGWTVDGSPAGGIVK